MPDALPPLALYVHIPWCVRKCPYCDFNSHHAPAILPEAAYLRALLDDLDVTLAAAAGRPLLSIFIGGGTPSLLRPETVADLLHGIHARLTVVPEAEITLEANPGTVEAGRFAELRAAGVNRLSIGIQSFTDDCLRRLGRIHDGHQAQLAVELAQRAGFTALNLDLMYGLPGQTLAQAEADVRLACALAPSHLSYYELTLEPGTPFHQQPPVLPEDDLLVALQDQGQALLAVAGFAQYEISAYAQPGQQCRHNRNYWEFGDYLGIGAGAHAKLTVPDGTVSRHALCKHPASYQVTPATARYREQRTLQASDLSAEFMLGALRLTGGFPIALFQARTGLPWAVVAPACAQAEAQGWLTQTADWVQVTPLGQRYLNTVIALFFP